MEQPTFYRTIKIDGLSIFYREAGPKDAPTLLLLHGLPSSSRMFEPLFARLSDRYHLVAPAIGRTRKTSRIRLITTPRS
jgi:pimeloyl-ACP methyl ester carboxylesterase